MFNSDLIVCIAEFFPDDSEDLIAMTSVCWEWRNVIFRMDSLQLSGLIVWNRLCSVICKMPREDRAAYTPCRCVGTFEYYPIDGDEDDYKPLLHPPPIARCEQTFSRVEFIQIMRTHCSFYNGVVDGVNGPVAVASIVAFVASLVCGCVLFGNLYIPLPNDHVVVALSITSACVAFIVMFFVSMLLCLKLKFRHNVSVWFILKHHPYITNGRLDSFDANYFAHVFLCILIITITNSLFLVRWRSLDDALSHFMTTEPASISSWVYSSDITKQYFPKLNYYVYEGGGRGGGNGTSSYGIVNPSIITTTIEKRIQSDAWRSAVDTTFGGYYDNTRFLSVIQSNKTGVLYNVSGDHLWDFVTSKTAFTSSELPTLEAGITTTTVVVVIYFLLITLLHYACHNFEKSRRHKRGESVLLVLGFVYGIYGSAGAFALSLVCFKAFPQCITALDTPLFIVVGLLSTAYWIGLVKQLKAYQK
eukprot:PhF_6_TR23942/c0_g1_i1/m.33500